jgi:hypothetical protein
MKKLIFVLFAYSNNISVVLRASIVSANCAECEKAFIKISEFRSQIGEWNNTAEM